MCLHDTSTHTFDILCENGNITSMTTTIMKTKMNTDKKFIKDALSLSINVKFIQSTHIQRS